MIAAIRGNAKSRQNGEVAFGSFMSRLEDRYASLSSSSSSSKNKKGTKQSKESFEDIPDDEFEKIQAQLMLKKRKNGKKK